MTILYETYKDAHTITEYYGLVINDVVRINYNPYGQFFDVYGKESVICTIHLKLLKRLEIYEDGE